MIDNFRELTFNGFNYFAAYVGGTNHATYLVHEDEVSVRNTLWSISTGDIIFDIGADAGSYSLAALAQGASYVYAWSPQGDASDVIEASLKKNGWESKCRVLRSGLYDKIGRLNIVSQQLVDDSDSSEDVIEVSPLDSLDLFHDLDKIDWMKLDVEGAEVEIIKGANELIGKFRPKIMIENHIFKRSGVCDELQSILHPMEYAEVCRIPYLRTGWPTISHSLWIPKESSELRDLSNKVWPSAHYH
jgi:FkbM family methyltransferase